MLFVDHHLKLKLLRTMLLIRRFEERCAEEYAAGNIRGFLHLYIGQEAVASGVIQALSMTDPVFATYREHGHALARGIEPRKIMAEMFGKLEGLCRGRGGSMHLFSKDHLFFGGNAIVGGAIPLAVGYALGKKVRGERCVVCCFFGEGAVAEGEFHEALNLAVLWRLPVLFLCENNLYAMGTALARSQAQTDLCIKARSYGVAANSVDGMDALAVLLAADRAVTDIRELDTPYFLECKTYRFRAHSMFDPDLYRDADEIKQWQKLDPIQNLLQKMTGVDTWSEDDFKKIQTEVDELVNDSVVYAQNGSLEAETELTRFTYSDTVPLSKT